jgi:hypothetical protein
MQTIYINDFQVVVRSQTNTFSNTSQTNSNMSQTNSNSHNLDVNFQ